MALPQTLGKYEIRGTLGRGAMGIVYDGWDPLIARRVAIKTVPLPENPDPEMEEEIARFRREAQAAGRLTHPNIVSVYDYGETGDCAFIVMEFVDGPSLKGVLDKQERFALPVIGRIMEDLLAGLQFSHERGVVHRDVKPANVMLTGDGRAKIADFGIARIESSSMTQAGTVLGTPAYMSPEQFMGQIADARSDVYSSGVLLYQLLTGERPFEGGLTAIMHKALNTEPPAPSAIAVTAPKSMDAVVRRAMAKRPDDRFASAAALAAAIRTALAEPVPQPESSELDEATMVRSAAPAPAPVAASPVVAQPGARRMPVLVGGGAALLLLLGGGGWFLMRSGGPAGQSVAQVAAAPAAPSQAAALLAPPAPAPSAAPVAAPAPAQPPSLSLAGIQQTLAQSDCTLAQASQSETGQVAVTGLAGSQAEGALRGAVPGADRIAWHVTAVDPVFCDLLGALRPVAPLAGAPSHGLGLALADGSASLTDGSRIMPRVTMADFAGDLRVDYVGHDGSIVHLYPTLAEPSRHVVAQPARRLAAGAALALGDAGPGRPVWEVGPPYGTDMIVAVAASVPLAVSPAQNAEDNGAHYLRDLQSAIAKARQDGAEVTATVMPVDTLPKGKP